MSPVGWVAVVVVVLGVVVLLMYNRLVKLRNRVESTWADLDVQLTRRHELVPNLVEVVKGYATHERETFEQVLRARTRGDAATDPAELTQIEEDLASGLNRMMLVAEDYPDLKANKRFGELQVELVNTEDKIAFSRQLYNDVVTRYLTTTQSIPWVFLAKPMGFQPPPLYAARDFERTQVQVQFDTPGAGGQAGGPQGPHSTEG